MRNLALYRAVAAADHRRPGLRGRRAAAARAAGRTTGDLRPPAGSRPGGGRSGGPAEQDARSVRAEAEADALARDPGTGSLASAPGRRGAGRPSTPRPGSVSAPAWPSSGPNWRALVDDCSGMVVTGGHVGVLLHLLHIFGLAAMIKEPLITWSAGAMALSERVVLFHDQGPPGRQHPEVFAEGLGAFSGVLPFPASPSSIAAERAGADVACWPGGSRRAPACCCPTASGSIFVTASRCRRARAGSTPTGT